ncbi:hypothetical protein HaLaN_17187 [Haematococcus lacustris]|uniref:Uncharacterized protein n=1 Tax=Haematococcus lacustris TaxID=44745 RepID=A0A699ZBV0_HAELA|nr:hypothetical protein HaLaN_17187 [Haematococcus lacustris]
MSLPHDLLRQQRATSYNLAAAAAAAGAGTAPVGEAARTTVGAAADVPDTLCQPARYEFHTWWSVDYMTRMKLSPRSFSPLLLRDVRVAEMVGVVRQADPCASGGGTAGVLHPSHVSRCGAPVQCFQPALERQAQPPAHGAHVGLGLCVLQHASAEA